ncbi:hypothetical protein HanPI659440_Chr02g0040021 [Helianthus annuus]|nr:hypothetical protein HanPI659440_Chr02g0040021 [Helianthus annuus]
MERSESLRNVTGAGIAVRPNGWRALDQLRLAEILRHTAVPLNWYLIHYFLGLICSYMIFLNNKFSPELNSNLINLHLRGFEPKLRVCEEQPSVLLDYVQDHRHMSFIYLM